MRVLGIDPGYAIVGWGVVNMQATVLCPSLTAQCVPIRTRRLNSA